MPESISPRHYQSTWSATRAAPATEVRAPRTATALVVRSETTTAAIVAVDVPFIVPKDADRLHEAIGREISAPADHVMQSVSRTHGGLMSHATGLKIGGLQRERSANKLAFIENLPRQLVSVAGRASRSTEPVRVAGGAGTVDLAINRRQKNDKATPEVPAFLQAMRIGDGVIASMPGEAFSELAIAPKQRSAAATLFAAYTNGVLTYLPTAERYIDGGYECDYAHHSYGLLEQIAPESERILVETSVALGRGRTAQDCRRWRQLIRHSLLRTY